MLAETPASPPGDLIKDTTTATFRQDVMTESMKQPHQTKFPVVKGLPRALDIMRDKHDALILGQINPKEYTEQLDAELKAAMKDAYDSL